MRLHWESNFVEAIWKAAHVTDKYWCNMWGFDILKMICLALIALPNRSYALYTEIVIGNYRNMWHKHCSPQPLYFHYEGNIIFSSPFPEPTSSFEYFGYL